MGLRRVEADVGPGPAHQAQHDGVLADPLGRVVPADLSHPGGREQADVEGRLALGRAPVDADGAALVQPDRAHADGRHPAPQQALEMVGLAPVVGVVRGVPDVGRRLQDQLVREVGPVVLRQRVDLEARVADPIQRRLIAIGHDDEADVAHGLGEDGLHGAADILVTAVEGHRNRDRHEPSPGRVDGTRRRVRTMTSGSRPKLYGSTPCT